MFGNRTSATMRSKRNQQFEETLKRSKADPPPLIHKSCWRMLSLELFKTKLYCVRFEIDPSIFLVLLLPFISVVRVNTQNR
ncbi:CLUMA_CG017312, isoform A [Clunio marinus]|uniref:CLUMA_CG017312, isoform A n=1 Tax=Clunio marinus TaxID=568069 RepID=A0A1J1IVF2_9DIPT|nr:CLUMA_CG017312, isoform A [Clunio marinus]